MAATDRPPPKAGLLAALRRHLARGGTFREAQTLLSTPQTTLYRLAERKRLPRRRRGLAPAKKKKLQRLLASGLKPYQAARKTPVSTRTAWAYAHLGNLRTLVARANTPRPCRPWRCPIGGELLNLTICVAHGCRKPPRATRPRS